jgi:DNA-binding ferritin-like protein
MSLHNEINKLKRIRRETSNSEIEELLKNLVESLETIQNTLNNHEVRLQKIY